MTLKTVSLPLGGRGTKGEGGIVAALLFFIVACTNQSLPEVRLCAAASLAPTAQDLAAMLASTKIKLVTNFASSSAIAQQVKQGAPCDVVFLADSALMNKLSKDSLIDAHTRQDWLGNRLVIITRRGHSFSPKERIAIGDPSHVPAGAYAQKAFKASGMHDVLRKALLAPDVRSVLLWVERGEVDAGVVYETDALSSTKVQLVRRFTEQETGPIRYSFAGIKGRDAQTVKRLLVTLNSEATQNIFKRRGFQVD